MKHGFRKRVTDAYWPDRIAVSFGTKLIIQRPFFALPLSDQASAYARWFLDNNPQCRRDKMLYGEAFAAVIDGRLVRVDPATVELEHT